jgi:hypothetical protein
MLDISEVRARLEREEAASVAASLWADAELIAVGFAYEMELLARPGRYAPEAADAQLRWLLERLEAWRKGAGG